MKTLFSYLWITGLMVLAIFQLSSKINDREDLSDFRKESLRFVLVSGLVSFTIFSIRRVQHSAINDFIKNSGCLKSNQTSVSVRDKYDPV